MNRTDVDEIKARLPIEELLGSYIKLEKAGKSYKAKCPFHNEKSPSFFVSPDRGGYYCFGCGAKGDIFTFVEQFEGLDFRGALKVLAERAGVTLRTNNSKNDNERDQLFAVMELATNYFQEQLAKDKNARGYLDKRGLNDESIKTFRIGWAPEGWRNLQEYLKSKGWSEQVMEKAGLIKEASKQEVGKQVSGGQNATTPTSLPPHSLPASRYYDRFRGRIIFPITDSSGRVIAFTGRILKDDGQSAKYLNSPDTPLFNKSQVLFGLNQAKSEIRRLNYSILVEGQMDLVLSHQVGVKNTVAASGTALTDQVKDQAGIVSNLGLVKRLSPNMILALDSDKAGKAATMRAVAATALAMGMSVKIAVIDGGKDPADLILDNPDKWKDALRNAKHVVEFELNNVIAETKDRHNIGRALKERVFPFLSKIDGEMDKAYYIKIIAERIGVNESAVWDDLRKYDREHKDDKPITSNANIESKTPPIKSNRLDLVERRIFGLLALMEAKKIESANSLKEKIAKLTGDNFKTLEKKVEGIINDLTFEAEAYFGTDPDKWDLHIKDLLTNYESDLISVELVSAMAEMRLAEKAGEAKKVAELAKKCQALSLRKAELSKTSK